MDLLINHTISSNTDIKYTYFESSDGDHTVYIRKSNNIIPFDKFQIYKLRSSYISFKIIYPTHKDTDITKLLDTFVKNQKSFSYIIDLLTYLFITDTCSIFTIKLFFRMLEIMSAYDYNELTLRKIQFTNACLDWPKDYSQHIFTHFDKLMAGSSG
jgi:hypothetical protein